MIVRFVRVSSSRSSLFSLSLVVALGGACLACSSARVSPRSRPAEEAPGSRAELDPKKIVYAFSGQDQVRRCLEDSSEVHGTVQLTWTVTKSGDVKDLHAKTTLPDETVSRCLAQEVKQLSFGRLDREARARWTFVRHLDGLMLTAEREELERKERRKRLRRGKKRGKPERPDGYDDGIQVDASSPGSLAPERIEQRAHAGFQLYGHCFREGFARNPELSGVVKLSFVIAEDGHVTEVRDGGSDLADARAISCIAEGFYALTFPPPSGGEVKVLYPVVFNIPED